MWITPINSFAEAEARYNNTKVLVSKLHPAEHDVRPLGSRGRKYERIIKVDDNTYALSIGGHVDPVFTWGWGGGQWLVDNPITPQETAAMSPIVWRRLPDGSETVTVRNGVGEWQHNNVYSFLRRALPRKLDFKADRNGRHAIFNRTDSATYYLPKGGTVPAHVYKRMNDEANKNSWAKKRLSTMTMEPDGAGLTFKVGSDGSMTLVGTPPKEFVLRRRVDKDLKSQFKSDVAAFLSTVYALYPMMKDTMGYEFLRQTTKEAMEIAKQINRSADFGHPYSEPFSAAAPVLVRDILKDVDHPLRHTLNIAAMDYLRIATVDYVRMVNHDDRDDTEERRTSYIRRKMNDWVNRKAGFADRIKEEK